MRIVRSLEDVQKILKDILDWKDKISTKDWDFHQLKITNATDGTAPRDYVTLEQLEASKTTNDDINKLIRSGRPDQNYTIVFSKDGVVVTGENSPPYIVGTGREGQPIQVWVAAEVAPTSANLTVNVQVTYTNPGDDAQNSFNLLLVDLVLPIGQTLRVFTSTFITPLPSFGHGVKVTKVITSGGNAAYVSIGVVVQRIL